MEKNIQKTVHVNSYAIDEATKYYHGEGLSLTERKAYENDDTMVTIVCITYKHEEYISSALDSFLMQKTNFKFKIFVGEDCGPDNTAKIVLEYAKKYPDIVVPFIREQNMGAQRNLIDLCQRATSPYIAFCEGDDYWIDENKLQKQVDYMEKNKKIAKAKIDAPDDWFLRPYYGNKKVLIYPDCEPNYKLPNRLLKMDDCIWMFPAHTSTVFYRWNYDLSIPEWYYRGIMGDLPNFLMQLGDGNAAYMKDIVSVYRRSNVGIFMSSSMDEHFLKTRLDHLRWMEGMLQYYANNDISKYPKVSIENRIKLETCNYLSTALKLNDDEAFNKLFEQYHYSAKIALGAYLSFYKDQRALTNFYGWDGYKMIARNKYFRHILKPFVKISLSLQKINNKNKSVYNKLIVKIKTIILRRLYWMNTKKKKYDNIWIFAGFNKKGYMDNTKYFYEYVINNCPDIKAYWITLDDEVFTQLKKENKPVLKMRTSQCRKVVSRAAIAVIDHYRMSDIDILSGLNDNLKIVQLWHGVGLKSIKDLKNTNVSGVTFSNDILPVEGDNKKTLKLKKRKYKKDAPFRELFERYFLLVCPGEERKLQIADPWGIPRSSCFVTGHPRNIYMHLSQQNKLEPKILYAPTYRWEANKESKLVNLIVENAELIQETMQQCNGEFVIRLHPHTWHNFNNELNRLSKQFDRIKIDTDKDIYKTIGEYSIVISDYSSIAYDFVLLDRPVIFFNYDFEDFIASECTLNYDYDKYSPGEKTKTWEETMSAVKDYLNNPEKDGEWRRKIRDEFYDMSVNDEDNSKRIVEEIKRRLKADKETK